MKLPPDWSEFIALLAAHRVRFLIVGAHALAANGRPAATQDIDFWVEPTPDNARRLCAALGDFGCTDLAVPFLGREEFLRNKRASGRPKDLADVALLTEADE